MELPTNESTGTFQLAPEGNHIAVCHQVIDLGTQEVEWEGTKKKQRKVLIGWELCEEMMEPRDGEPPRPFVITKRYTFSVNEKATFRKHLESWRGKSFVDSDFGPGGFNVKKLIGIGCMLQMVHKAVGEKTYANISSVASLPKGLPSPKVHGTPVYFSLADSDANAFHDLPGWMQKVIAKSPEYNSLVAIEDAIDSIDQSTNAVDGIPF